MTFGAAAADDKEISGVLMAYHPESEPCCILLCSILSHNCPSPAPLSGRKETNCARFTFSGNFFYETDTGPLFRLVVKAGREKGEAIMTDDTTNNSGAQSRPVETTEGAMDEYRGRAREDGEAKGRCGLSRGETWREAGCEGEAVTVAPILSGASPPFTNNAPRG